MAKFEEAAKAHKNARYDPHTHWDRMSYAKRQDELAGTAALLREIREPDENMRAAASNNQWKTPIEIYQAMIDALSQEGE